MNIKFFFMGDEIQGAHSMREDGDYLVIFASGNFPGGVIFSLQNFFCV